MTPQTQRLPPPRKRDFWSGCAVALVFVSLAIIIWFRGFSDFSEMKPGDWGDFLVGVFGPASFLLLARGYFMQRNELELQRYELAANREALLKQHEELEKSAKQSTSQTRILLNQNLSQDWSMTRQDLDAYILSIYRVTLGYFSGSGEKRIANPTLGVGEAPVWLSRRVALTKKYFRPEWTEDRKWNEICADFDVGSETEGRVHFLIMLILYKKRMKKFLAHIEVDVPEVVHKYGNSLYGRLVDEEIAFILSLAPKDILDSALDKAGAPPTRGLASSELAPDRSRSAPD